MMRFLVGTSLKFRFLVVAFAAAMMIFGFGRLRSMPVDVFPEFAPPRVEIQTPALGLSAGEVESLVTVPLEHALTGVPGLSVIRSKSVSQLSSIELIFEPGVDLLHARQVVQERVATVTPTLPSWASPPFMMQPLSATSRAMKIGLSSRDMSLIEMSSTAYWKIRARLLRVPGVANVPIWGERIWQLHVQVDPQKMRAHGATLDQVMQSTADALDAGILRFSDGAVIGTGGFIDTQNQRLTIRHVLPIISAEDLSQVPIKTTDGKVVRLGDVAELVEDYPPLAGEAVINDGPGLMLIVEKLPWGNTLDVTRGVEEALAQMKPGLAGIEIDSSIFRPATFVEMAINNLSESLLIGVVLMIIVLVAFLFDWRSALISAVTIPLSLTAAGLVLYFRGATINTMILAGFVIALGAVVDDAIVDIENIVRRLRENRKRGSRVSAAKIILDASLEVRGAVVYASMIEALALLPVFFLTGLSGSFFRPLAFSYALAVLVSMIVALIVTPALSMILLSKARLERRESPLVKWLQKGYERILSPLVASPRPAYAVFGVILISGLIVLPRLGQDLLPAFKERDFLMHWVTAPGTSLPEETRITTAASRELRSIPGVRNFGAHIGQALLADEVVGAEFGENWISVDPKADYDKTVQSIQEVVDGYPGLKRDVLTYLKERIREVLTGEGDAIVVKIYGQDLEILRSKAQEVKEILSEVDGVVEEHVELQLDIPQVEVEVNLAKAERWGIKPGDVRRAAAALVASEEVGDIYRDGKAYDVHVWSTPQTRNNLTSIGELPLDTPSGEKIRLADVAEVRIKPTPNAIFREGASRTIVIGANLRGRDLGSVVEEFSDRLENVEFPLGYHANILGENAERQAAQNRLLTFTAIAIIGIFSLLFISLGSLRLATLSFVTLPMAMVGGVLAAFSGGGIISLGSLVGFFTVLGIVARNGIMMISHYQHLERHEGETFGPKLVLRGSRERLAPILMTALTTGLALVPLVIFGNIPGQEIEYPMAIVILGGLVTSTLLNLFVVPSLYLRFGKAATFKVGHILTSRSLRSRVEGPIVSIRSLAKMVRFAKITNLINKMKKKPKYFLFFLLALAALVLLVGVTPLGQNLWSKIILKDTSDKTPPVEETMDGETEKTKLLDLDPSNFTRPTNIDNEWWPLKPGTQLVYEGYTIENGKRVPHRIVDTVTDLTKEIGGVKTVVSWEQDFSDGVLVESELAFHAQDNDGNVWHLGQYSETYEEGVFVGGRIWYVNNPEGAKAGIRMTADPQIGKPSYSQGYAPPPFSWTDRARVHKMGEVTSVPAGNYEDVLVIEEWDQETPAGAFQLKYYARGVGTVRVDFRGEDPGKEKLELVGIVQLNPEVLASVRQQALELEKRGYMYSKTAPAK